MWENSSISQKLNKEKFQDKETAKKLVEDVRLVNQKTLNYIDSFHPKTEEIKQAVDIKKLIIIAFCEHIIQQIELSSKSIAEDELAKIYCYRIRNLLSVSSNIEAEINYKLNISNPN